MKKMKMTAAIALSAAAALTLAACGGGSSDGGDSDGGDSSGGGGEITVGYVGGWTDGQSITYLIKNQAEKLGYDVKVEELADNGPLYAGLSNGDIDIHASAWPEVTQAAYMEEFGDDIEDLGTYYPNAVLTLAVPSYSSINSMDELADNADLFGSEIIGIEPGAGLTQVTQDSMMPEYGLDDWTLATSSTASMLTVLGDAIDNNEEVVVTLWRPFWANSEYDIKDLEDPLGAMGEPEGLHSLAHAGFGEEHKDVADLIAGMQLSDDAYGSLESLITSEEFEGDPDGAVAKWIEENPDGFSTIITE